MNKEFLKALLEIASPSGCEKKAAALWRSEAERFADLVYGDYHGNSFAKVSNNSVAQSKKIMLAGHIDEIGLMISRIDSDGYVYFQTVGGWDPQILPGQRVKFLSKDGLMIIKGCVGRSPIHLLNEEERKMVVKTENLWIDVGGREIAKYLSLGDYGVIDYSPDIWGDNLVARGIDDRIGAFVVLEVLRLLAPKKNNLETIIYAVATVQEEIGIRGAVTSAYQIKPTIGIAVDVTFATDYPGAKKTHSEINLGAGPVIAIGPNIHPRIYEVLVETAKNNEIPYQVEAIPRPTGTDANMIQLSRGGVAAGLVSIPCRYMHSPCEMVNLKDVENAIALLAAFCGGDIRKIFVEADVFKKPNENELSK